MYLQPISALTIRAVLACGLVVSGFRCSDSGTRPDAMVVDTLPNGTLRVIASAPADSALWTLVQAFDIQPASGDSAELLNPQAITIANDGSVLVAEPSPSHVKVFGPDGLYLRRLGREGAGPGEFQAAFIAVSGDTLVVQDPRNSRASMINWRTGLYLTSRQTSCCYYSPIEIDGSGRAVISSMANPEAEPSANVRSFVRISLDGTTSDTVFVFERPEAAETDPWLIREGVLVRMTMVVPLQPRARFAIDPSGGFVTGWSGAYELRKTSDGRNTLLVFGRVVNPTNVSDEEKKAIVEFEISRRASTQDFPRESDLRAGMDWEMIPSIRPAWEDFFLDDSGRTWVRLSDADTTLVKLDLFDPKGRWLDQLVVPASGWPRSTWSPIAVKGDRMAVILEADDARPFLRVYNIRRAGSEPH